MPLRLSDFDAVTFDVYGTLIDWEPSIIDFLRDWAGRNGVSSSEEDFLMAFDRARADTQQARPAYPYPEILRRCFDRICREYGVAIDRREREQFALTPSSVAGLSRQPRRPGGASSPCESRRTEQYRQRFA